MHDKTVTLESGKRVVMPGEVREVYSDHRGCPDATLEVRRQWFPDEWRWIVDCTSPAHIDAVRPEGRVVWKGMYPKAMGE